MNNRESGCSASSIAKISNASFSLRIAVGFEFASVDRHLHGAGKFAPQARLVFDDAIANGTGTVVVFHGRTDHRAALVAHPDHPVPHDRAQARQSALLAHCRHEDVVGKPLRGRIEHSQLQIFARSEVRENAALRHADRLRNVADGQAFETVGKRDGQRVSDNALARGCTFIDGYGRTHLCKIARSFVPSQASIAYPVRLSTKSCPSRRLIKPVTLPFAIALNDAAERRLARCDEHVAQFGFGSGMACRRSWSRPIHRRLA